MTPSSALPTRGRAWFAGIAMAVMVAAGLTASPSAQGVGSVGADLTAPITETAADGCPVTDAELTWGFKEAFRSYISGTIANGEWTTADGATYATPAFSWHDGTGDYNRGTGLIRFTGSVTFTGHGGILDTTVANPQLRFDDAGSATLLLDVDGTTQAGDGVTEQAVEFASIDLTAGERTVDEAGSTATVTFTGAPAELLAPGATAFGTYEAGEDLDPILVTFSTDADCAAILSDAPGGGAASGIDLSWMWWLAAGILALIVVVVATRWARRPSRS